MFKTILLFVVLSFSLEAVEITTAFYPRGQAPKEYEEFVANQFGDTTFILVEKWPRNKMVMVDITDPLDLNAPGKKSFPYHESNVICIDSIGYVPGCPITYTFREPGRKKPHAQVTIVPNRLYTKSSVDGAEIEAILQLTSPSNYIVSFKGFLKNEEIKFASSSYDEHINHTLLINKNDKLSFSPGVITKMGGISRINCTRANGETLKLELPWGLEWIKHTLYFDSNGTPKSLADNEEFLKENPTIAEYFRSER